MEPPSASDMILTVTMVCDGARTVHINCTKYESVLSVKIKIRRECDIPITQQWFTKTRLEDTFLCEPAARFHVLEDENLLFDYSLHVNDPLIDQEREK